MKSLASILSFCFLFLFSLQTEAANRYWIATSTANWNSTSNWSTTSGGSGGASVPGSGDIAIFNNIRVGSCTINATVNVAGISIVSGYTGTISQGSNNITVGSSNYSQAAGTFTGGSGTIDINGTFSLSGGTFTATTGNFYTGGTFAANATIFSQTGGTFNHNNGTYRPDPSGSFTFTIKPTGSTAFNNVIINAGGTLNLFAGTDTLRVNGALTMQAATFNTGVISVKGNATVTGLFGGTGVVAFTGTNDQTFTLTSHTDKFNAGLNVKLSSGKKLTLASAATFDNLFQSITLTRGIIVSTTSNLLTLGHGTLVTGASNSCYVDGPVKKIGNAAFTFPTGKNGYYRKISISAPTNSTDAYTAEYFEGNSGLINSHTNKDGSINQLSRNEYWNLTRNAGTTNVSITMSWDVPPSCSFSNVANTKVCVWNGTTWKDQGNGGTTGTTTSGTVISSAAVSTFGMFALGSSSTFTCYDNVSSVTLDSLVKYAILAGDTVRTASAINVAGRVGAVKAITGTIYANDGKYANNTGNVPNAMTSLGNLITNINGRYGLPLSSLNGISLVAGVYRSNGNTELNGRITLTGTNSDVYIFKVSGDLTIRSHSEIDLGDVLPHKVYWLASGNITVEDSVEVSGIFISQQNINVWNDNGGKFGLWASGDATVSFDSTETSFYSFYSYNAMNTAMGGFNFASALNDCDWVTSGGSSLNDGGPSIPDYGFGTGGDAALQDICTDGSGYTYVGYTCAGQNCETYGVSGSSIMTNSEQEAILARYNSTGTLSWAVKANVLSDGGYATARSVTFQTVSGTQKIYMAGEFKGDINFGGGTTYHSSDGEIYVATFNNSGTLLSFMQDGKYVGTPPSYQSIRAWDIDVDPSGSIYLVGTGAHSMYQLQGSTSYIGSFIAKYNPSPVWIGTLYQSKYFLSTSVVYTNSKLYVAGSFTSFPYGGYGTNLVYTPPPAQSGYTFNGGGSVGDPRICTYILNLNSSTGSALTPTCTTLTSGSLHYTFIDVAAVEAVDKAYVLCSAVDEVTPTLTTFIVDGNNAYTTNTPNNFRANGVGLNVNNTSNPNPDIYVTGSYIGNLTVGNTSVNNPTNQPDAFVMKINNGSNNPFVKSFGVSTDIDLGARITADNCKVYTTGQYSDQANFEGDLIDTHGPSMDAFVLQTSNIPQSLVITPTGGTPTFCSGGSTILDAGSGYTSYLWSTGATTQTITVSAQGTYSVTVATSCCSNIQASIFIDAVDCCIIGGYTNYSNYTATTSTPFTGNITINNDFIVNANVTFSNCTTKLGENARITVKAGKSLTLTNATYLSACDEMWAGIVVENGGTIVVNGATIEDAITAINMPDGASYQIDNSIFNKNRIHINITPAFVTPVHNPGTIKTSKFVCQTHASLGGAAVYENLRVPFSSSRTFIGINAWTARSITVGAASQGNIFNNAESGILCNAILDDIIIHDNDFLDMNILGIRVDESSANDDIDILSNYIDRTILGIYCLDNPESQIKIDGNSIDLGGMVSPPQTRFGIVVQEIGGGTISEVRITNNTITEAPTGIWALDLTGQIDLDNFTGSLYIGDNYVTHTKIPNDVQSGILVQNCLGALIVDNEVKNPTSIVNWWETGIRQELGNTNFIFCNNTHDIGYGTMISGDARPFELLVKNKMQNNTVGLFLNWGIIGQQGTAGNPNDNEWNGGGWSSGTPQTWNLGSDGGFSPFVVYSPGAQFYPTFRNANNNGLPIPAPATTGTHWTGGSCPYFVAPSYKTDEGIEGGTEEQILTILNNDRVLETALDTSLDWMGKYGLYKNLVLHPELITRDEIHNFFNGRFNGNTGKIERAIRDYDSYRADNGQGQNGNSAFGHYQALQHLNPVNKVESILKSTLGIFYSNIIEERDLNETEITELREIAELCPYTDGFGVFMARAMLSKVDSFPRIYTTECEAKASLYDAQKWEGQNQNEENFFRIYPNPNSGTMIFDYDLGETEDAYLTVTNMYGQTIQSYRLQKGKNKIDIVMSSVASGVYSATVTSTEKLLFKDRITIIK